MRIEAYNQYLVGCRFCPMCKPFGEVYNVTRNETHTTRIRGMLLWQIAEGHSTWDPEIARLLYESTLDSVSQAWCIHHYPVPEYILAARADIVDAGFAPPVVKDFKVDSPSEDFKDLHDQANGDSDIMLYPGDALVANRPTYTEKILQLLNLSDQQVAFPAELHDCGGMAYCLGHEDLAILQAKKVVASFKGAKEILVDGPFSYWMLTKAYPTLGVELEDETVVSYILDDVLKWMEEGVVKLGDKSVTVYPLHTEFTRLTDSGLQSFEQLLGVAKGLSVLDPKDGLELGEGSGIGGALFLTFPDLAELVSKARVEEAEQMGAEWLLCDSPLDVTHLQSVGAKNLEIGSLVEFIAGE